MLLFLSKIIDSFNLATNKGLPMGNQTSQCFALYYLDNIDRIIKEKYRIKGYVRYMDDGVVVSNDKDLLHTILQDLKKELVKLKLSFNEKKTTIFPFSQGVTFLGFKFKQGKNNSVYLRLDKNKKKRMKRHLSHINCKTSNSTINSYLAYVSKAEEYEFKKTITKMRNT